MKREFVHVLIAFALTAACGSQRLSAADSTRDTTGFLAATPDKSGEIKASTNSNVAAAGEAVSNPAAYVLDDKHKLAPGDRVSFQIVEDRTNAIPLQVTESTELDVPYIGRLNVSDRTCKQLAEEVKVLLEKDYYYRATVIIGLDSLSKILGRVYVWGPVRNQGPIEIPANEVFTVGKAIVRAGGFGDFANKKEVKVVRKTDEGSKTFVVNMVEVLERGKTDQDMALQPEDFVIVPQRAFNF